MITTGQMVLLLSFETGHWRWQSLARDRSHTLNQINNSNGCRGWNTS